MMKQLLAKEKAATRQLSEKKDELFK